jgi:hypothetical protein
MTRHRALLLVGVLLTLSVSGLAPRPETRAVEAALPDRLSDRQFWALVTELSEPDGFFRSDNLVSNEIYLQHVIPELINRSSSSSSTCGGATSSSTCSTRRSSSCRPIAPSS